MKRPRLTTPLRLPATDRQLDALRAIANYTAAHGYAPGIRDLCDLLGTSSTNGAADTVRALTRKGLLASDPMVARSLRVTEHGRIVLGLGPTCRCACHGGTQP